jgi:hypothetical protein
MRREFVVDWRRKVTCKWHSTEATCMDQHEVEDEKKEKEHTIYRVQIPINPLNEI